ncbi:MAG: ATP-dependent metallopeptidase FtsH/Yme1/Tma family protein [Atopobiaceae bacterium]|nr:ATP-dependent metallopeptidase FtsH/Yme1/Tma family protein [Atopobiaceae bacterium]
MSNNDNRRRRSMSMLLYIAVAIIAYLILSNTLMPGLLRKQTQTVSYSEFLTKIENNEVTKADLNTGNRTIRFTTGSGDSEQVFETTQFPNDGTLVQNLRDHKVDFSASIPDNSGNMLMYAFLSYGIPLILFLVIGYFINRSLKRAMGDDGPSMNFGGGFGGLGGNLGRANAKEIKGEETGITFKDVAGQEEAKESMQEIVSFLKSPQKYEEIGARCPRGALLVGPPGTGKTLIAKAVAGEAGVPFFQIAGSEFVEMFVGRGAAKVRDLFKQANEKAPCIIFIDEIDAVGKRRDTSLNSNDEREQTLNQLLSEMDGFDNHKGIVVLAATNRPETLDKALLRPGRFDRRIPVELPDLKGREAVLQIHANDVKMEPNVDLSLVAKSTPGASGADLANIINEAALRAVRFGRRRVTTEDLTESVDVVIAGAKKKNTVLSEHEKDVVAYHETGHAIVGAIQKNDAPVTKITIVPRTGGALGFTMQVDEDEHYLMSKNQAMDEITVLCGGRAAEELIFGEMTNGASNDIERATSIARAMVTQYGMSDKLGMVTLSQQQSRYLGGGSSLTCSEATAEEIDAEVKRIVEECHQRALQTLKENRFKLHEIAHYLQKKETITGEEFMNILRRENTFSQNISVSDENSDTSSTQENA